MTRDEIIKAYTDYLARTPQSIRLHTNQVGFEPIFDNDKSSSGLLWVPETAKGRCTQGIVKAIGPDVDKVRLGDYCIFSGYNGDLLVDDSGTYIIMPETMIAAVLVDDPIIEMWGPQVPLSQICEEIAKQLKDIQRSIKITNPLDSRDNPLQK